jgi:PhnB protein
MSAEKYVQSGFTAITPYLFGKPELREFLKSAFNAEMVHDGPADANGNFHAEATIGGARVMFGSGWFADKSMAAAVYIYVPDVDATYERALKLGATSVRPPSDQTWGDRVGGVKDGSGNTWWIATFKGTK